jgi:hypothetical protein
MRLNLYFSTYPKRQDVPPKQILVYQISGGHVPEEHDHQSCTTKIVAAGSLKRWYLSTKLSNLTFQKTISPSCYFKFLFSFFINLNLLHCFACQVMVESVISC